MIGNFAIQQRSSLPWLEVTVTKDGRLDLYAQAAPEGGDQSTDDPNAVDLSDIWSVRFFLYKAGRKLRPVGLTGTARVVEDEKRGITKKKGVVQYQWTAADTQSPGLYYGQFEIQFKDGTVLRWPYEIESLSVEIMEGGPNIFPCAPDRNHHDVISIVQGQPKTFNVFLKYTDTGKPFIVTGALDIVCTFPGTPTPIQEKLSEGQVVILSSNEIQIICSGDDTQEMNPQGGPPFQDLNILVTLPDNSTQPVTLYRVLNINPAP